MGTSLATVQRFHGALTRSDERRLKLFKHTIGKDHIVRQFAKVLKIPADRLFAVAGVLSDDDRVMVKKSSPEKVDKALVAFRRALKD